jgi:predicted MFS family arabinose efflux permease
LGLFLGTNFGWQVPFIVLAVAGIPLLLLTPFAMPPLSEHVHVTHAHPLRSVIDTFSDINNLKAFVLSIALMIGSFTVFPYVSAYFVANVGMTEQQLPVIYIVGGALTLVASPVIGKLTDQFGKLVVYRIIAPIFAVFLLAITHLPTVHVAIAVAVFAAMMVSNVGRMIAAMAMITGSVEPRRRGGFMSANASVQHIACGIGAYLGGLIIAQGSDGRIEHFGAVGWIAAISTLMTLWLAGRVRIIGGFPVNAKKLSLAAAAEATVDAGEPLVLAAEE